MTPRRSARLALLLTLLASHFQSIITRFPVLPRPTKGRLSGPAIPGPYCLSTGGSPLQVSDSAQAQAPSPLSAQDLSTWSSTPQSPQTYTSPAFISLHDAIAPRPFGT